MDEKEKQSAKGSGCILESLLDFLAAGITFVLAVEQHFFMAGGKHDLLSHPYETGKERIRSSAESGESSPIQDLHMVQIKHHQDVAPGHSAVLDTVQCVISVLVSALSLLSVQG